MKGKKESDDPASDYEIFVLTTSFTSAAPVQVQTPVSLPRSDSLMEASCSADKTLFIDVNIFWLIFYTDIPQTFVGGLSMASVETTLKTNTVGPLYSRGLGTMKS